MIVVKLMGGLGNQMFQYSTAERLAKHCETELLLDITGFDNMAKDDTPRHYELGSYPISGKIAGASDLSRILPNIFRPNISDRVKHKLGYDKNIWTIGEPSSAFYPPILHVNNNSYLIGWWQSEKYFINIRNQLISEFIPKKLSNYSKGVLSDIKNKNSVAIHVRRGDYVQNINSNKFHGLAPIDYYKQSIAHITKNVGAVNFFVCSDDIDWCRENLPLGNDAVFIDKNGSERACEDIYLMQNCQHAIIANSSFSWWAAWLNTNPNKIVIAPKIWFQDEKANSETDIVPDSWIRI